MIIQQQEYILLTVVERVEHTFHIVRAVWDLNNWRTFDNAMTVEEGNDGLPANATGRLRSREKVSEDWGNAREKVFMYAEPGVLGDYDDAAFLEPYVRIPSE